LHSDEHAAVSLRTTETNESNPPCNLRRAVRQSLRPG
jgi:hypothetical protein